MSQKHDDQSLARAIEAQQGHSQSFRPGTKLEHDTGKEISRTSRAIRNRAVLGMAEVAKSDTNPDGIYDLEPEKPNFTGQNAQGGQSNR